jgi:hypothetical protein
MVGEDCTQWHGWSFRFGGPLHSPVLVWTAWRLKRPARRSPNWSPVVHKYVKILYSNMFLRSSVS